MPVGVANGEEKQKPKPIISWQIAIGNRGQITDDRKTEFRRQISLIEDKGQAIFLDSAAVVYSQEAYRWVRKGP